jgi:hypothetical protein
MNERVSFICWLGKMLALSFSAMVFGGMTRMKPDFQAMTKSELKKYLLQHRHDDEAFWALMDKAHADPEPVWYSIEDADRLAEILPELRNRDAHEL